MLTDSRPLGPATSPATDQNAALGQNAPTAAAAVPTHGQPALHREGRETLMSLAIGALLSAPFVVGGVYGSVNVWQRQQQARAAFINRGLAYEHLVEAPALPVLDLAQTTHGRDLFVTTCAWCHGEDAKGKPGMGMDLVQSDFVAGKSDTQLVTFLSEGRPEAKPMAMPPKGGQPDLTDADLSAIATYVRGLQDPRRMPALPAMVVNNEPNAEQLAAATAAAGGDAELAGYIASGNKLFHQSCVACHGKGGVGIAGNGKALAKSEFIASLNDDALLEFIQKGRSPTDPKNSTGIQMPPKGGNPALSEDDLLDIIAYLRTLQAPGKPVATTKP